MSRAWITEADDGRTVYKFHQSWLSDTDLCLERARLGLLDELPREESDATAVGTALHLAAQVTLEALIEYGEPLDELGALEVANEEWERLQELPEFRWVKRGKVASTTYLNKSVRLWHQQVLPKLDPVATELYLGPYVLHEDERRVVQLAGTADYVDRRLGLMDWKTGSAHSWKGKDWEKQRWSIQATAYTWMHWMQTSHGLVDDEHPFTFVVMRDDGVVQWVPVVRRPEDWAWLKTKVLGVVDQIERGTASPWPRNDQHALCSPKWCPAWAACKGADVAEGWPK